MAILPRMKPRDRGTIVQVGSALAYRGIPLQTAYCGAKHAIQGFHESLRCELLHEKQPRARDDGADACRQHPTVPWVLLAAADEAAARAADLPARGRGARGRARRRPPGAPRVLGRGQHRRHPRWPTRSPPACSTATWPAPASPRSRQTSRATRTAPTTSRAPPTSSHDYGTRGPFDDRSIDRSPQLWASQHHGLLGAVGRDRRGRTGRGRRRRGARGEGSERCRRLRPRGRAGRPTGSVAWSPRHGWPVRSSEACRDRATVRVARVLGVRHLAQALGVVVAGVPAAHRARRRGRRTPCGEHGAMGCGDPQRPPLLRHERRAGHLARRARVAGRPSPSQGRVSRCSPRRRCAASLSRVASAAP